MSGRPDAKEVSGLMPLGGMKRMNACMARLTVRARIAKLAACTLLAATLALGGCSGFGGGRSGPINAAIAGTTEVETAFADAPAPASNFEDTTVALSFSGGGTRAAAFAFGVLRELARTEV